jgi:hypothetical protein
MVCCIFIGFLFFYSFYGYLTNDALADAPPRQFLPLMTNDDLEDIDLDAFFNVNLLDKDKAREAVFLRAQSECLHGTPIDSTDSSRREYKA